MSSSQDADAFAYLRKESLDIYNRLHSIEEDSQFVERVRQAYPNFPILPNLRCGAWYTNPASSEAVPAYFKSTDGHFNNWSFNLRRANLHLLPFLLRNGGLILVDSTRAGKKMPDALSKTIPIWCAVINRAIALRRQICEDKPGAALFTPPGPVSVQEHHQIDQRLDAWAKSLVNSSFELPALPHPLRPFWITPSTSTFPLLSTSINSIPIICVSASKQMIEGAERRTGGYTYIQGSGDDHELWGMGLDPQIFWKYKDKLLSAERSSLPQLVKTIVSSYPSVVPFLQLEPTPITRVHGLVSIASASSIQILQLAHALRTRPLKNRNLVYIMIISSNPDAAGKSIASGSPTELGGLAQDGKDKVQEPNVVLLTVPEGKKGQLHFLQDALPRAMSFVQSRLFHCDTAQDLGICCICDSKNGLDRSVGVALAALQIYFNDDGGMKSVPASNEVSKKSIQTRLEWIISSEPRANPSRTTLKRVNEYLMSPQSLRYTVVTR